MTAAPEVSIIIPAHNAARHLPSALDSARAQTLASLEIIVVDDASNDATAAVVDRHAQRDPRIRLHRCAQNLGPAGARNQGLELARGAWIALLDSDDAFEPTRLERLLAEAGQRACDMIADDLLLVADDGSAPAAPMLGDWIDGWQWVDAADFLLGNLPVPGRPRISLGFLKPMIRRAFLERHGLRYHPGLRFAEDFDLYLRALLAGARFGLIAGVGYRYTIRAGSATDLHTASDLLRLRAVDRRLLRHPAVAREARLRGALARHLDSIERRLLWRLFTDRAKAGRLRAALRLPASSARHARLVTIELLNALPRIIGKRLRLKLSSVSSVS